MPTVPTVPAWVKMSACGGTLALCFTFYDTWQSRRGAVPTFNSSAVRHVEEYARYPCRTLQGMDVVVKNYYCNVDPSSAANDDGGIERRPLWLRQRVKSLFSNDAQRHTGCRTEGDATCVRLVVRSDDVPSSTSSVLASSSWPPGSEKYTALVLEPSRAAAGQNLDDSAASELHRHLQDPLRWMADAATHQSLVHCNPRSTMLDMNCEGDPAYLGASYLRVMLTAFSLLPQGPLPPQDVAVLGVGGGSLPAFLHHYFSRSLGRMDLVDIEPRCLEAAVADLGMLHTTLFGGQSALSSSTVQLLAEDGAQYLRRFAPEGVTAASPRRPLDLIFVDMFMGSELPGVVSTRDFMQLCRDALSAHGVVAFNLPAGDKNFVTMCSHVFGRDNVYAVPAPACANMVVLARGGRGDVLPLPHLSHRVLYTRAQDLCRNFRLPYDLANHYPLWWRFW